MKFYESLFVLETRRLDGTIFLSHSDVSVQCSMLCIRLIDKANKGYCDKHSEDTRNDERKKVEEDAKKKKKKKRKKKNMRCRSSRNHAKRTGYLPTKCLITYT